MKPNPILFFLIIFKTICSEAQQLDFEKYYFNDSINNFENHYTIKTSDNGFLMTGKTVGWDNYFFLLKLNESGDTVWMKTDAAGGPNTSGESVKELSNGTYALVSQEMAAQILFLAIYDSLGNLLSSHRFLSSENLSISNINESNGKLYLMGDINSTAGTFILKTDLSGDSISYYSDTTFVIANNNHALDFDGNDFIVTGTTFDTSGVFYPSIAKYDTSGNVLLKIDYTQFTGAYGKEIFRYSNGYIFRTIYPGSSEDMIRLDTLGAIVWNTQVRPSLSSVTCHVGTKLLVVSEGIYPDWYDSTGTFLQSGAITLTLPGYQTVVNAFSQNQQIYISGTTQTGLHSVYSSAYLLQLTDTTIALSDGIHEKPADYFYPTICASGGQINFHFSEKSSPEKKYSIYTSQGRIISAGTVSANDATSEAIIKIPDGIICGVYFVKIFSTVSHSTFKIIVQ